MFKNELLDFTSLAGLASTQYGDDAKTLSKEDLEEVASEIVALTKSDISAKMKEVRAEFDKLFSEGRDVNDQKVKDAEKKFDEISAQMHEAMDKIEDQVRLMKAERGSFKNVPQRPEGGPADPMFFDFKGEIMPQDQLRAIVDQYSAGDVPSEKRTIDTGKIATAGKLSTEVADRFIDLIIQETTTLARVTNRRMVSPEARLDEMFVATRKILPATEATAPALTDAVSFTGRTVTTREIIWTEDITLSFLEDNIERANAEANIVSAVARTFGTDLNDLGWNGTADDGTDFLGTRKGWATYIAESIAGGGTPGVDEPNVLDITTPPGSVRELFRGMHKAIPQRYKSRTDYAYFVPTGTAENYADEVEQRETAQGDAVLLNGFPALRYFGRPVIPESHLADQPYLFPTPFALFGIQRSMRIDGDYRPRRRVVEYTLTTRIGYQVIGVQTWVTTSAPLPGGLL